MDKSPWPREGQDPFVKFLARQRKSRGMTLQQLAEVVGVSAAFLSYVESGSKVPKPETGRKLARALEISPFVVEAWIRVKRSDDVEQVRISSEELQRFLRAQRRAPDGREQSSASVGRHQRRDPPLGPTGATVLFQRAFMEHADLDNQPLSLPLMPPEDALMSIRTNTQHPVDSVWVDRRHFSRTLDTTRVIAIRPRGGHSGRSDAPDDPGQIFVVDAGPAFWKERARFVVWTDSRLRVMLAVGRGKDRLMISQADPSDSYLVRHADLRADAVVEVFGELLLVISEVRKW